MKWVLVALVFGSEPIQTDLVYPTLAECVKAQQTARTEMADLYNQWNQWARANQKEAGYPKSEPLQMKNIGMFNQFTCVPHS